MIDPHAIELDHGFYRGNRTLVRPINSRAGRKIKSPKEKTREVLTKLEKVRGEWVTPRQIKGKSYPHHSGTMRVLADLGIIEKRRREGTLNRYEYRLRPRKSGRITAANKRP